MRFEVIASVLKASKPSPLTLVVSVIASVMRFISSNKFSIMLSCSSSGVFGIPNKTKSFVSGDEGLLLNSRCQRIDLRGHIMNSQ